jgi:hypothetical protein
MELPMPKASSTLTRQHFNAIAATIQRCRDCFDEDAAGSGVGLRVFSAALASELARFNPRFDRSRFLRACGAEE